MTSARLLTVLRRVALGAALLSTGAGVVGFALRYRATGTADWADLARALTPSLAAFTIAGVLASGRARPR